MSETDFLKHPPGMLSALTVNAHKPVAHPRQGVIMDYPRLTNQSDLLDAITARKGGQVGSYSEDVSRWYTSQYGEGGQYYHPLYTQIAMMPQPVLERLMQNNPDPHRWLQKHWTPQAVKRIPQTWAEILALSGRAS